GVQLKQRLAAGTDDHRTSAAVRWPLRRHSLSARLCVGELSAAFTIGADKNGVTDFADRSNAIDCWNGPQVAGTEAAKHGRASSVRTLALVRAEDLLDLVGHAGVPWYSRGSLRPASAKPLRRRRQESQWPHGRPRWSGS